MACSAPTEFGPRLWPINMLTNRNHLFSSRSLCYLIFLARVPENFIWSYMFTLPYLLSARANRYLWETAPSSPALYLRVPSATINTVVINTAINVTPLAIINFEGNYDGSCIDLARHMVQEGKGVYIRKGHLCLRRFQFSFIYFSSLPSKSPLTLLYHHSSSAPWSISYGAWHG